MLSNLLKLSRLTAIKFSTLDAYANATVVVTNIAFASVVALIAPHFAVVLNAFIKRWLSIMIKIHTIARKIADDVSKWLSKML